MIGPKTFYFPTALRPPYKQIWHLHDPGDRREITTIESLFHYALSPCAESIDYVHGPPGESRIYVNASDGREVHYVIPARPDARTLGILVSVLEITEYQGKLAAA
jgi:hypothetical protein